jgi:hypothetical protein
MIAEFAPFVWPTNLRLQVAIVHVRHLAATSNGFVFFASNACFERLDTTNLRMFEAIRRLISQQRQSASVHGHPRETQSTPSHD